MLPYQTAWYEVGALIQTPIGQTRGMCIVDSLCDSCNATTSNCSGIAEHLNNEMFGQTNLTRYGSGIEYRCPPGQMFKNGTNEWDAILIGCDLPNETLAEVTELPDCEGIENK